MRVFATGTQYKIMLYIATCSGNFVTENCSCFFHQLKTWDRVFINTKYCVFYAKKYIGMQNMKCNASLGRTRLTGHYGVNKLLMTEILFGTPNSKTKGSLGLPLKISTENPDGINSSPKSLCEDLNYLMEITHWFFDYLHWKCRIWHNLKKIK